MAAIPIKFPSVDVVEASAGSGKTYALARQYIRLLMDPRIKSSEMFLGTILAVTFTNKATLEMKQRILQLLKKIALDEFTSEQEKKDILSFLPVDSQSAKKTAREVLEQIITSYSFFQVQTIDSFINTLLAGCAFYLGFSVNFRIKEDYRAYLEYCLDQLIDKLHTDKDTFRIFDEFLQYYLFSENKPSWFCKMDILALMAALYNYSNIYGGIFRIPSAEMSQLWKKKQVIINLIRKISTKLPDKVNLGFARALGSFLEENKRGFEVGNLSSYFARRNFPINKNGHLPPEVAELWGAMRRNLKELCEMESYIIFKPYIEIFNLVLDNFRKVSGEDDVIFLSELNTRARFLLEEQGLSIAEIYYRLTTRLRYYLIDEFQDTSSLQWKNIFPMIDEALSSGGSLFYVGDKKQAIYRFRGGNISLFDSVQNHFKAFEPDQTILAKNYRSQKEIVQFNNEIFSADNLRRFIEEVQEGLQKNVQRLQKKYFEFSEEDISRILGVFSDSTQDWKKENTEGYVRVEPVEAANVDERDAIMQEKLISLVKGLTKDRFSFADIAILARENEDVKLFTSWLLEEGIPVASEKTLNIREHPLIKEIISFLKFLNSPIDNLSFASFILGDIFCRASGISRGKVEDFLFRLHNLSGKGKKGNHLFYKEFRNNFNDAWSSFIEEFFKSVGFIPLYELVVSMFARLKVMENFPEYQGFFMRLLELIKEKEDDYGGLSSFLELFEDIQESKLYVNFIHADAVKVTTIHKAKGLEFGVVIVPFLEMNVSIYSAVGGSRRPYVIKQFENNSLALVQLKKKYGNYSKRLADEYKNEYIKCLIDELNALYVALTRARYELYLFLPSKASNKKNIVQSLISLEENTERGTPKTYQQQLATGEAPSTILSPSQYSSWIGILKEEFIDLSQLINRDKILRGNIFHFILSFIGNLSTEDKDLCLASARQKATSEFPYVRDFKPYLLAVRDILENDKFRPFFYLKEGSVYQEKEVVDSSGNLKRIDRLIIMPGQAWIVDYKSSKDEELSQKEQILEYKDIIQSIYPALETKCFLIYLDTLSIEEVE